jgi:ribonuclease I
LKSTTSKAGDGGETEIVEIKHLTSDAFHTKFYESEQGKQILSKIDTPFEITDKNKALSTDEVKKWFSSRYRNSNWDSLKLLTYRYVLHLRQL